MHEKNIVETGSVSAAPTSTMDKRVVMGIVLGGLVLRLIVFAFINFYNGKDAACLAWTDCTHYVPLAQNLVQGHGFSMSAAAPYVPDTFRTPGYPLFLAFFIKLFGSFWSASLAETLLNSALPFFSMWLAFRLTAQRSTAYLAGVLTAIEPHLLIYTASLNTEALFPLEIMVFLFCLLRWRDSRRMRDLVLTGIVFGLTGITRPVFAYYLPIAIAFILIFHGLGKKQVRSAIVHVLVFVGLFASVICPWIYRNYTLSGQATLATIFWFDMYSYLGFSVQAIADHSTWAKTGTRLLQGLKDEGYIENAAMPDLYRADLIPLLKQRSLDILWQHPKELLMTMPLSVHALFSHDELFYILRQFHFIDGSVRLPFSASMVLAEKGPIALIRDMAPYARGLGIPVAMRVTWYLLFLFACYGAISVLRVRRARLEAALCLSVIAYLCLTILVVAVGVIARFRTHFEPVYFIFVAVGMMALYRRWRSRSKRGKVLDLH